MPKIVNIEVESKTPKNDPTIYGFSYSQSINKEDPAQSIKGDAKEIKKGRLRRGTVKLAAPIVEKKPTCEFNDFLTVPKDNIKYSRRMS